MCVPERRGVTVKEWLAGAMFVDSVCEHKNSSQNSRVVGSQPAKQQKRNCRRRCLKKTQGVNLTRSNFLFTNTWRAEETNRFLICPMFSMTLQLLSPSTAGLGIQVSYSLIYIAQAWSFPKFLVWPPPPLVSDDPTCMLIVAPGWGQAASSTIQQWAAA